MSRPLKLNTRRWSELFVELVGHSVSGALDRILGLAHGLLRVALNFLRLALGPKLVGANGFTDAGFQFAGSFVRCAFDLVACATHENVLT